MKICEKHKDHIRRLIKDVGLDHWAEAEGLCYQTLNVQAIANNQAVLGVDAQGRELCPVCFLDVEDWCDLVVRDLVRLAGELWLQPSIRS